MIARAAARIDRARDEMARASVHQRERTYPDRIYRYISRQIDRACEAVEQVNLAGGRECPEDVGRFIMQLQVQAGEAPRSPRRATAAHDELFRLSSVLLGRPAGDLDIDLEDEAAQREAER